MIKKEDIVKELEERGYNVRCNTVVKNGDVEKEAICIRIPESNLAPNIYIDEMLELESVDEAVETILNIYKTSSTLDVNVDMITDKDFIFETVRIAVQKTSNQEGIKLPTEYDDIEQYLYFGENDWTVRLSDELVKRAGITDLDELWNTASKNTFKHTTCKSMFEIMREMMGDDFPAEAFTEPDIDMWVISNEKSVKGASAILDKDFLLALARKHGWNKIAILPSSIHECIIVPVTEETSVAYLDKMVQEVNATQVEPVDRLIDHAIVVNFE